MDLMADVNIHFEDKKESRSFFIFICIMYSVVFMTKNCFSSAMASIVSEGIFTKSQTGLITTLFYLVYTPLQILGGIFADKYNPERMIKIGLIGSAIINLIIFLCHNYYVILIAWLVNAIVQFPIWPSVFKIISSQLCRSDRPQMVFYVSFTTSLGMVFGFVVAAVITKWEYNFAFSSVILFVFSLLLHIFCKKLNPYVKPDCVEKNEKVNITENEKEHIFIKSGFVLIVLVVFIRCMVEYGIKSFSPTLLMERFSDISPSLGNILNVLIIVSGICGSLIIKKVLYPKYIKNEIVGILLMLLIALPFCFVFTFLENISVVTLVVSLCVASVVLTATNLLTSYYTMYFVKWGKNGTAAGIVNSAASLGLAVQSYGFMSIVESFGWISLGWAWTLMIAVSVILSVIAVPIATNFKKKYL